MQVHESQFSGTRTLAQVFHERFDRKKFVTRERRQKPSCGLIAGMDLDEIHRQRLLALIEEAGGMANLARELGHKTTSTLSQYKGRSADSTTGKPKSIGKALCRDLERVRNKPHGWMDLPLGEGGGKVENAAAQHSEAATSGTRADYALRSVRAVLEAMGFDAPVSS